MCVGLRNFAWPSALSSKIVDYSEVIYTDPHYTHLDGATERLHRVLYPRLLTYSEAREVSSIPDYSIRNATA
jgi:hypothetical protein